MAHSGRSLSSNLRHASLSNAGNASNLSPALMARINEKRQELEGYKELRDLSAQLAEQMQSLQEKLATVTNGAEAVATVLSNWQDVLNAIKMASTRIPMAADSAHDAESEMQLPQTLIRIPIQPEAKPRV